MLPSRASILTGGYSHATGVYTNVFSDRSPYGTWQRFHDLGDEDGTIAGRILQVPGRDDALALFDCSDNLRKGAALNAVQMAEQLFS